MVHEPDNWFTDAFASKAMRGLGEFPTSPIDRPDQWKLWERAFSAEAVSERERLRAKVANKAFGRFSRDARWRLQRSTSTAPTRAAAKLIDLAAVPVRRPRVATRPVVKTVYSVWNAEEIASRFDAQVVVVRRELLEGAASWHELGFGSYPFGEFASVCQETLHPAGAPLSPRGKSGAAASAWTYAVLDLKCQELTERNPSWLATTHGQLIADPVVKFSQLFEHLGIEVSDEVLSAWVAAGDTMGGVWDVQRHLATEANKAESRLSEQDFAEMAEELLPFL